MLYWLEPADLAAISQRFGVRSMLAIATCALPAGKAARDCPYLAHTGYELPLMLDGRKKLAHMYFEYPPHRHPYEDQFDRFVAQGLLHKEVDVEPFDKPIRARSGTVFEGLRTAYYTPKGEEWRIQAFRLIEKNQRRLERHARAAGGHALRLRGLAERLVGRISPAMLRQFGTSLVYAALTPSELAAVELSGFRALPALDRSLPVISSC